MPYGKEKDDQGNKGRRSGKGPKPMKGSRKARKESARQERKNLITENPVVNRSNDSGFDYSQSKRDIKKRYKQGPEAEKEVNKSNFRNKLKSLVSDGQVSRFQGSTKKLGNTGAMQAMIKGALKPGLSAGLGEMMSSVNTSAKSIKQPLRKKVASVDKAVSGITEGFTPSKRTMELQQAHDSHHVGTPQSSAEPREKSGKKKKPAREFESTRRKNRLKQKNRVKKIKV